MKKWWRDAVEQREKHKTDKYRDLLVAQATRDGNVYTFLPFVMTVHGDTGPQADQFMDTMAREAVHNGRYPDESGYRLWANRVLAVAWAEGAARVAVAFGGMLTAARVARGDEWRDD